MPNPVKYTDPEIKKVKEVSIRERQSDPNESFFGFFPPSNPDDFINDQALRMNIQQFLESSYNPNAVSPAGARGLYQIMPGTQKDLEDRGFIERGLDPFNPEHSKMMRDAKINSLLKASWISNPSKPIPEANKLARIYAAYNWGEGNVLKMLENLKTQGVNIYGDPRDWTSFLPEETRNYVGKILYGDPTY